MLLDGSTAAGAVLILARVAGTGLALGQRRVRGLALTAQLLVRYRVR